jgi:uncharacterized protein
MVAVAAAKKPAAGQGGAAVHDVLEARDGKTAIRLIHDSGSRPHGQRARKRSDDNISKEEDNGSVSPALIVGFPGPGLVGSICANYIIDTLHMHQVASVDSEFVVPTVVYIGGRLRHPFRIYSHEDGSLYVLVCEAPLMPQGIHSIMDAVVKWAQQSRIGRVIVLDGIPFKGLPEGGREPLVLTDRHNQGINNNNDDRLQGGNTGGRATADERQAEEGERKEEGAASVPGGNQSRTAIMTGLAAGLLSSCLSNDLDCMAVLVPASSGVPDPEGAAILLEKVSKMPNVPLELDVQPLRKQGREIRRQLGEMIERVRSEQQKQGQGHGEEAPHPGGGGDGFGIYG